MKKGLVVIAVALLVVQAGYAAPVARENFDGGALNLLGTSNVFDFNAGGGTVGDCFGRVSQWAGGTGTGGPFDVWDDSVTNTSGGGVFPTDTLAVAGQNSSAFFGLNDMDGFLPLVNNATWTFDISGALTIHSIKMRLGAMGDFETASTDGFLVEARIDAGAYQEIFKGRTDEAAQKTYRAFDDGDVQAVVQDPLELYIDGVATDTFLDKSDPVTGLFDLYTSTLFSGSSGSTMDIRVSWAGTPSGSEPMGIDNIIIVPEPVSLSLLGLGGLVALRRRC